MSDMGKVLSKISGVALQAKKKIVDLSSSILKPVMTGVIGPVVTLVENKPFAEQVTKDNTIYIVKYEFDLQGEVVQLPFGCTLDFQGGRLRNGTLVGQGSVIHAYRRIFENVTVSGLWDCVGNAGWFADGTPIVNDQWGCRFPNLTDQSAGLQRALDSAFRELHFPPKCFYISKTLVLTKEKKIILHGSDMKLSLAQSSIGKMNTAVIFSDQNICLLRIAVNESYQNAVSIEGGSFDVSLCGGYSQNCIEVRADEEGQRMWGLTLNTSVKGLFGQTTGTGININPVENAELTANKAFVTHVRINSMVSNFGTGVKATNYMNLEYGVYYNWCTDIVIDGSISNCPLAVDTNVEDADIRATKQTGHFFEKKDNGQPLIRYTGPFRAAVSSAIYDLGSFGGTLWSNELALSVTDPRATVVAYGRFLSFYKSLERIGKRCVSGNIVD